MWGTNADRIIPAVVAVAFAVALVPQQAMARSVACWRNIMCVAGQAVVEGMVRRGLDGSRDAAKAEPTLAPAPEPAQRSEQPLPPARIPVCDVIRECRVVSAGPCFRVSPTTIRCPRQRQCRVRRVCGRP